MRECNLENGCKIKKGLHFKNLPMDEENQRVMLPMMTLLMTEVSRIHVHLPVPAGSFVVINTHLVFTHVWIQPQRQKAREVTVCPFTRPASLVLV